MKSELIECINKKCGKGKRAYKCGIDKDTGEDIYACKSCNKIFKESDRNVWKKTHASNEEKQKIAEEVLENIENRRKGK